jgi:carboxymethylenebutenolidase
MNGRFEELAVGADRARLYVSGAANSPAVVVYHPWWGLNDDVLAYADRLAGAGFFVLAPDLVRGRAASTIPDAKRLASQKDEDHADAVALAAIDRLVAPNGREVGTLGFSMGGAWAVWCAAKRSAVKASVIYYATAGPTTAKGAKGPVLGHFAERDEYEPDESIRAFQRALEDAGRTAEFHRYPGTGHWFAEPSRDAWRKDAADLAFQRTVTFLKSHVAYR